MSAPRRHEQLNAHEVTWRKVHGAEVPDRAFLPVVQAHEAANLELRGGCGEGRRVGGMG